MSLILSFVASCLIIYSAVPAQDSYNSKSAISSDYNQVTIVAKVNIVRVEAVQTDTRDSVYRVITNIIESYKGGLKPGGRFTYMLRTETGYPIEKYRGQKIVFLNATKPENPNVEYWSLENSDREPTKRVVSILRSLKKTTHKSTQ